MAKHKGISFTVALIVVLFVFCLFAIVFKYYVMNKIKSASTNNNVKAFLAVIRFAEGTSGPNGYRTTYGYKFFNSYKDHPYITGEWKGALLPDSYCIGAGLKPGCKSTAAGAYQITVGTWRKIRPLAGLVDFSPANQDLAAIELIREHGALEDVIAGNFSAAINKVNKTWASLPGYDEGQPEKAYAEIETYYLNAGGTIA